MVVEYELLRRLDKLRVDRETMVKEEGNKFDVNNQEQTNVIFKAEPEEKEEAEHLALCPRGEVVVKKVTAMRRPDQVLYQPPFSRQTNKSNGVGRGKHQRLLKEDSDIVVCKNLSEPAGQGKPVERMKKRRPEGEGVKEGQGPRVESIKYQDVQQGVKREKMMRKSPVKENVEYQQRDAPNQRQLVLHTNSGRDAKYESKEEEKWKRAEEAEKDEREEYWRRLEEQRQASKNVERAGSAEESRRAGARTTGKAFYSPHRFNQENAQRLP